MQSFSEFLRHPLNEATYDITQDVDWIFNKYFKTYVKALQNGKLPKSPKFSFSSSKLKSDICKKAHKINPIKIVYGDRSGNSYIPKTSTITISVQPSAVGAIEYYYSNLRKASDTDITLRKIGESTLTNRNKLSTWLREFDTDRVKGSIRHELTHWLDDTLHGRFINKWIKDRNSGSKQKHKYVGSTDFERNGSFSNIIDKHRAIPKKEWDSLTFEDLVSITPSLTVVRDNLKRVGEYAEWKKSMIKRLSREKMLGKNMRYS